MQQKNKIIFLDSNVFPAINGFLKKMDNKTMHVLENKEELQQWEKLKKINKDYNYIMVLPPLVEEAASGKMSDEEILEKFDSLTVKAKRLLYKTKVIHSNEDLKRELVDFIKYIVGNNIKMISFIKDVRQLLVEYKYSSYNKDKLQKICQKIIELSDSIDNRLLPLIIIVLLHDKDEVWKGILKPFAPNSDKNSYYDLSAITDSHQWYIILRSFYKENNEPEFEFFTFDKCLQLFLKKILPEIKYSNNPEYFSITYSLREGCFKNNIEHYEDLKTNLNAYIDYSRKL